MAPLGNIHKTSTRVLKVSNRCSAPTAVDLDVLYTGFNRCHTIILFKAASKHLRSIFTSGVLYISDG